MGMAISHAIASGMGGMRTAGDLVARVQMSKGMRLADAKKFVADKLGVAITDLTDPVIMGEIRQDLGLGVISPLPRSIIGIKAKKRISEVLGLDINCVRRFFA